MPFFIYAIKLFSIDLINFVLHCKVEVETAEPEVTVDHGHEAKVNRALVYKKQIYLKTDQENHEKGWCGQDYMIIEVMD